MTLNSDLFSPGRPRAPVHPSAATTYCLSQPIYRQACVEMNWRPQAHAYMMGLPRRYLAADRLLVLALIANKLVGRVGVKVVPTALGIQLFMQQFRFCSQGRISFALRPLPGSVFPPDSSRCDARPSCWRPDPGSVSFRNPCTV